LLVEDDPATGRALGRILGRKGCDVRLAPTLSDARSLLGEGPDGIVLDLMLPDGDGADLLRQVRSQGPATRVVVTTGASDPSRLRAVSRLRPDALLTKPIDLDELVRALGLSP
jgi:DNA-binding response OmpR family regulator